MLNTAAPSRSTTGAANTRRRISHRVRPEGVDLHEWQRILRRQAGEAADFRLRDLDGERFFGDFAVDNPDKGSSYRVVIRSPEIGTNRCSCPDFTTNTLGTCKHLEFVLHRLSQRRGAAAAWRRGFTPDWSQIVLDVTAGPRVRWLPGSACPPAVVRAAQRAFAADGQLGDATLVPRLEQAAAAAGHDLRVDDAAADHLARLRDDDQRRQALHAAYPRGARSGELTGLLPGAKLLPYQKDGMWFLAQRGRALLADDMGLGKTIQAIAAARLLVQHGGVGRILVVAPASLKGQWADEIARFARQQALVVGGPREQRAAQWADPDHELKIVNYELLHHDRTAIAAWDPDLLILDEAQRIKNWATLAAQAVRQIPAPQVFVLTGTPLENRIEELHALVEVVDPHLLGPLFAFRERHAVYDEQGGQVVGYRDLDRIAETLQPVLLRRSKAEVLRQLPKKTLRTIHVPWTDEQQAHHDEDRGVVARLVAKWRRQKFLHESDQLRLRVALQRMRMVCDSTYLLDPSRDDGHKIEELRALLQPALADPDSKVVLFSGFLKMHELVRNMLEAEGWGHVQLHGGVPAAKRGDLIKRFHEDPACRVFCSTDAGGTGLNLQCADMVVNVDLPWNPAVLEQRIGRVYRLGQKRPVNVVNLVSEHGIERSMERLLSFKRDVFAGVLEDGAPTVDLRGRKLTAILDKLDAVERDLDGDRRAAADEVLAAQESAPVASSDQAAAAGQQLAAGLQAGAMVLTELAKLAATFSDPAHIVRDPATGQEHLQLPLGPGSPLAGLQQALAAFAPAQPA